MLTEQLDDIDLGILRALQDDGRLTVKELAAKVHRSTTPVFERLKRLETNGYIRRYVAIIDADKVGQGFMVFCCVKLSHMNRAIATEFTNYISDLPEVTECYNVSGDYDYLLKIYSPSMSAYQEFLLNKLGAFEGLGSIESTFVMSELKHDYHLPF